MIAFAGSLIHRADRWQSVTCCVALLSCLLLACPVQAQQASEVPHSVEPSDDSQLTAAVYLPHFGLSKVVTAAFLSAPQDASNTEVHDASQVSGANANLETLPGSDADSASSLTAEFIASFRAEVELRTDLDEALKTQVLGHLDRAAGFLQQRSETDQRQMKLKSDRDNGPTLIAELKAELEKPALNIEPEFPHDASVSELERLRLADLERLEEARKKIQ